MARRSCFRFGLGVLLWQGMQRVGGDGKVVGILVSDVIVYGVLLTYMCCALPETDTGQAEYRFRGRRLLLSAGNSFSRGFVDEEVGSHKGTKVKIMGRPQSLIRRTWGTGGLASGAFLPCRGCQLEYW